jgi:hypothetical protein
MEHEEHILTQIDSLAKHSIQIAETAMKMNNNQEILHKHLSCLIADYCETLAELKGLSKHDIHKNLLARLESFQGKPESHLYVVR